MSTAGLADELVEAVEAKRHILTLFKANVAAFFEDHPTLRRGNPAPIHSVKSRVKSEDSIRGKVARKLKDGVNLTKDNLFQEITDFAGVRVLHLLQEDFSEIHAAILGHVNEGEWWLAEAPKAYTWDPDAVDFFKGQGVETLLKPTRYTSVHYLVRPREGALACCEIQVRTLWEEIWGEVDHALNYPQQSDNVACVEQIRVLARLIATGTRLADSIFVCHRNGTGA